MNYLYSETTFEHHFQSEPLYVETSTITLLDHVGPHVDAPAHMIKGGKTVEEIQLNQLIGRARILDFSAKVQDEPLLPSDFEGLDIGENEVVIVYVGYEPPSSPQGIPSYPYLSGEAAEYLASIPIRAFASDMPSAGNSTRILIARFNGRLWPEVAIQNSNVKPYLRRKVLPLKT